VVIKKSSEAGNSNVELAVVKWVEFWRWQTKVTEKKWQERNYAVQRTLHMFCSDSEIVINPLPGYD
jgi:hypothetical protein